MCFFSYITEMAFRTNFLTKPKPLNSSIYIVFTNNYSWMFQAALIKTSSGKNPLKHQPLSDRNQPFRGQLTLERDTAHDLLISLLCFSFGRKQDCSLWQGIYLIFIKGRPHNKQPYLFDFINNWSPPGVTLF